MLCFRLHSYTYKGNMHLLLTMKLDLNILKVTSLYYKFGHATVLHFRFSNCFRYYWVDLFLVLQLSKTLSNNPLLFRFFGSQLEIYFLDENWKPQLIFCWQGLPTDVVWLFSVVNHFLCLWILLNIFSVFDVLKHFLCVESC